MSPDLADPTALTGMVRNSSSCGSGDEFIFSHSKSKSASGTESLWVSGRLVVRVGAPWGAPRVGGPQAGVADEAGPTKRHARYRHVVYHFKNVARS